MMSTTGIRLRAGNSLLGSFSFYSETSEKLGFAVVFTKNAVTAKKSSSNNGNPISNRDNTNTLGPLNKHLVSEQWVQSLNHLEDESSKHELSVESLLLLQKSLLEKQWNLSTEKNTDTLKKVHVAGSQVSARKRRIDSRKKTSTKQVKSTIGSELLQNQFTGYVKGGTSEVLLTHSEVVVLSKKIKIGLLLEEQKVRLKKKLGVEPSDEQLATSMEISQTELRIKQIECILAREKLTLSNVRLVMSVAQKYDNMGAQMADLIQGGLIGLLRGIEKYDSAKGFKISTYVYWWIRQGVSRALMENSKILRLPNYLHERQSAIRNAKVKLEEQGISPSIDRIAESLNISRKKVLNATQAITKVFSLDNGGFPSINSLPGQTQDNETADNCLENNPWHGVDERALKDEVNKLINMSLGERERNIIRLYYGLDNECLTWEDIGRRIGLSREGVRQIGLVAHEKLKNAAKKTRLEAMLTKH